MGQIHEKMNATDAILFPTLERGLGNAPALCFRNQEITYTQLLEWVNRIGNGLKAFGVAREQRVLLMMNDSPDLVSAYLAIMKIGAVAVAVNVRASEQELLFFLRDTRCTCAILDEQFLPIYQKIAGLLDERPIIVLTRSDDDTPFPTLSALLQHHSPLLSATPMSPDDMAFWIYSSGTTGTPKAAVHLQHDVLTADIYPSQVLGVGEGDRLFASSRLFFAYALGSCLFGSLRLGATTVLHDDWPTPQTVANVIVHYRPNFFFSVPVFYRNLLRSGIPVREIFSGVRACISAGECLPPALAERWQTETGVAIYEGFGTSECINMVFANKPGANRPKSAGKVCPDVEVKLTDPETDALITVPGKAGVLWVSMPSLCERYWNQQARSNDVLQGRWFRTGDLFTFNEDGFYFHQGRVDDMLKISGQWVSPAEIETQLQIPEIVDVAAVGIADEDELERLALFVVPHDRNINTQILITKVTEQLRATLAIYKCPRTIHVVEALPRTANGKIQRYLLRTLAKSGKPELTCRI